MTGGPDLTPADEPRIVRAGRWAWAAIGIIVFAAIVVSALAAVGGLVLPIVFGVVLAVVFRPAVLWMVARGVNPSIAAAAIVLGLLGLLVGVLALTVVGVAQQIDEIGAAISGALAEAGLDAAGIERVRESLRSISPMLTKGFAAVVIGGVEAVTALGAAGLMGALIMYYVLRDGGAMRRRVVRMAPAARRDEVDAWVSDSIAGLRQYGMGRTVLSAIVAAITAVILGLPLVLTIAVVNFIGGYVPYLGGLIGGGLAVTVAFAEGGIVPAVVMLVVSLLSNLLLENFVEPKVMGDRLDMHPALVLVITSLGGVLGGLVGLMLAVPFALVARAAFARFLGSAGLGAAASRAHSELRKLTGSA
jgi:predicted PurR-regulated permease PerM